MKKFKRKWKGSLKRAAAIALAVLMVSNTIDMSAFAVSAADETQTVLCEHHTEHTAECGYSEGTEEVPCTHVHGEECSGKTEECSAKTEECVHTSHDASCGYGEVQEGSSCTHEHDEACGEEGVECTHTEHTSDCGYAEAQEGSPCTHECSEENGCIIVTENCTHTEHDDICSYGTVSGNVACSHEHDDTCGYVEAKEGTPCNYVCELCADENKEEQPENEIATCTCETDDPAIHATNCPAYAAPENPECFCGEKCTEDNINVWCDVCGVQGAEACTAEGEVVMYADVEAKWGTSASDLMGGSGTFAEAIAANPAYIQLQSDVSASYLTIKGTTTLDLNNYTITGDGSQRIFGVDGGNLTLTDTSGMQGGQITNAGGDAAVVIFSDGQFTMEAGSITGNTKGGVRIYKGTFTMTGGSITGNTSAGNGGGVLNQGATFIMNGGSITGNTGNQGGGIFSNGTFELSGTVDISGNTGSSGSDIYLSQDPVNITGALSIQSSVYVYMGYTSDYKFATAANGVTLTETHKNYFISDHPDYPVVSLDSENNALCLNSCDHSTVTSDTCNDCNSKMVATLEIDGTTTYHHSLKTAFNAAVNTTSDTPGIITLLDNINGAGYITITSGVVTLNLNNKTLEASFYMQGSEASLTPKNGTINSNDTGLIAGIYVYSGSVTLDNVIIEGNRDYDIYIANDAPIIIQSIPNGEVYTVKAGSGYAGKVFAKPADGVGALSKENWTSLHPGGLITENTDGSLAFAACDHSGSEHITYKDTWVNQHSFICTVCNGTAYEEHYGGNPTCLTAATCSFCEYSYTVDHQYTYSATENVITETCIYNCEHSETVTIEAPTEIFVYDGTAKEGATVIYSNSENWQGERNLTPTYENNINAGTATASISVMDGEKEVKASATFTITAKDITGATIGDFTEMTYTGQAQTPVATVTINGLTATGSWSKVTNVGEKTTFTASGNFTGTVEADPDMAKATPDVTVSATDLTYNAEAQELVSAGSTTGGTLQYALGTDNTTAPGDDSWGTTIPTGTDADTYYVWYKVVGDTNYVDVMAQYVEVTINPKQVNAIYLGENFASEYPYTGVAIKPEVKVLYDDDTGALIPTDQYTVVYSSNTEPINVGEYYIGFKGVEGGNYTFDSEMESDAFMYRIIKAKPVITWSNVSYTMEYNGSPANISADIAMQSNAVAGAISYSYTGTVSSQTVSGTGLPTNAGSYTVTASYAGDANHEAASAETSLTITQATPVIGTVTANALKDTLDVSQVELNRTKETVAGTLALTDDTLQYGTHTYNWKFTPTGADAVNYEEITGTVEITVSDTIAPTATYQIGTDGWKQFINTITFGLFCKDYRTVEISYSDGDNGSGIATQQYYISNEEITDTSSVAWVNYTDTISLNAKGTYFIYVRVADKGGNEVILNSEGIVIYAESTISPAAFDYVYKANTDRTVQITMNGNTFAKLTDGAGNEISADNYTIDKTTGTLTLNAAYLDTLDKGEHTYKICMNPQGVEITEVTLAYTFTVNVTAKELTVTGATATSRDYNGTNAVDITDVALNGVASNDAVSVDLTGLQGTLSSVNAGTYTSVTLPELTLTGADAENYTLVQPTGAVTTNVTINKLDAEITVGTDTYSKTFGDEAFTLNVTDTNDEANVQYAVTAGADVVSVSNGTVTILKAGTATITVSMPESTNYNAAVSKTITVNVAKDSYTVNEINKSYLYTRENADSINIAELLPTDCGTVSYGTPTATGTVTYSVDPLVTDGTLSYTVASGAVDATGKITVVVETQNYEDITITVNVKLIDQIPVSLKAGTEVTLQNNTLTYGEALSKLVFNSAVFVDDDGKEVAGTLAWKEPTATPDAGTRSATWVFTPNNAEYASVEGTVAITVNKATPAVSAAPTVAERVYNPNVALADTDLTGGTVSVAGTWSWQTANVVPVVNNSGYVAVFTPNDTTNYETVTRTITVSVTKATPVITDVSGTAITYGDTLSASTLSGSVQYSNSDNTTVAGSFAWKDINVKPAVADSDSTTYAVEFTPSDTVNYNTVETTITLTVNKAENAPNMPGSTMSVPYSNKTVSAVTLPEGWAWQDADKDAALEVGVATNATAVYVGTDKGNYENESVTVAITRSDCEHTNTEVRNAKDATCEQAGYTGDTYCKDCGECTATGTEIPLADHTGGIATCTKKPVCSVCDQEYGSTDSSKHGETEIKGYVAATCTAGGYTGDTYCKDCGTKLSSGTSTGAMGHDYSSEVTKEPTTTEEGVRTYTCANCKDTYTESIPKLPEDHKHNYTSSVTKEPSCTENGVRTYTCSCGDSYTEPIAKTNHSYTSEVTKEPTTTEEGVMTYTCSVCKHTYTKAIEKLPEDNKPDTEKPFIKDDKGKEGWDVIRDEVEDAKDGDTVTVDMNGTTVVPGDVFDDIKDRDITIVFDMGNGITWSVNGKDITSDNVGDIDFGVKVGADANNTIPVEVINKVTGERYYMNISLAYDGEFGFTAVLSLNMDAKNAGLYAYLYYFNEQKGELEFICEDEIAADGTAELTFTHASEYTIIIDEKSMEPAPDTDNTTDEPETDGTQEIPVAPETSDTTGDAWRSWWIVLLGAVIMIIGFGVFFVVKKKKETAEE